MKKILQWLIKVKLKIAIWATPLVLLFYFDDRIHLRDRIYYFFLAFFKSIPLLMLYSYFSMWKDKNEFFYAGICTALLINALVGGVYHFKAGTFSIKKFLVKNTEMVFIIVAVYISLSLLSIPLDESEMGKIFKIVVQLTTLLYPVSKTLKNAFILTNGKYPPQFIMKALYNYEREGKLKDFFDKINKGMTENNKEGKEEENN
ncbi:hypothetical protein [Capnocytophaga sp. oral taxon 338]|uniref:hypothetical protein n=1 Tax=Capnocytophaga sp. oral taxon 338 TaxID=710239 RepID=UPI000202D6DB|nr:hypothetical protein [Capnocytophaga sp. oral taxon 338]EGD33355.1 hypothetical protein HMPREF9071_2149 [Capnocytophaga sp. oral taxon 338 str. F0234]